MLYVPRDMFFASARQKNTNCRDESEHRLAVRKIPAFQTLATLCQMASDAGIGGLPSPVEVLREATLAPLQACQAQGRPEKGSKEKGRAHRQVGADFSSFRVTLISLRKIGVFRGFLFLHYLCIWLAPDSINISSTCGL